MKSIMTAVSPYLCEKIASGACKILAKKSAPKEVPFKDYIYATKATKRSHSGIILMGDELLWLSNGEVVMDAGFKFWVDGDECQCLNERIIGEFICNEVEEFHEWELSPQGKFADFERERLEKFLTDACLSEEEVVRYRENLPYYKPLYGWHISDLKIYDKPKELSEFRKPLDSVYCSYYRDYCEEGCVGFGSTDYVCNDYWEWEKGLTRPPRSWQYVEEAKR